MPRRPVYRLHLNESPIDLPHELKSAAAERLLALDWSRYPEEADRLVEDLARVDAWCTDGIVLGNGFSEVLQLLMLATLAPGDAVVLATPCSSLYGMQARAAGARIVNVPLRSGAGQPFRFDVERLVRTVQESRAKLLVVGTPHNPTGTVLRSDDIRLIHDQTSCSVAVDETFRHFARQDLVPLLKSHERLVLLRTFSKAFGAAAVRMAYVLAARTVCSEFRKVLRPYSLGAISCALARALLTRLDLVEERTAFVIGERERMIRALRELPTLRVEDSAANSFVVEHASRPASELAGMLAKRGVLVRDLSTHAGCEQCLRVSVGTVEANDALVATIREMA